MNWWLNRWLFFFSSSRLIAVAHRVMVDDVDLRCGEAVMSVWGLRDRWGVPSL